MGRFGQGVYVVGRPEATPKGRWMAAVLACGPKAALSHRSAAALWGFGKEAVGGPIDVTVRGRFESRRTGVRARSRPQLPAEDVLVVDGIPVTSPARTLLDEAAELLPPRVRRESPKGERRERLLERLISEANKLELIDPDALRAELERRRGEPGVRPLRELLDRHGFLLSDSDLEIFFRRIVRGAKLPMPLSKQWVNGHRVDFYWPDLRLVVETDSLRYHRMASTQARDLERDQAHTATGLTTLRFSHYQVGRKPHAVRGVLRETLARLSVASTGLG
jgi:very-short-patch-repair endonuclease